MNEWMRKASEGMWQLIAIIVLSTANAHAQTQNLNPSGTNERSLIVARVPASLIQNSIYGGVPNANGYLGANTSGWQAALHQRGAMDLLTAGVFLNNQTYINDGVRAIEATYLNQQPNGAFGEPANLAPGSLAFWMGFQNHAVWVLKNSPYWSTYQNRINPLLPKMRLAMNYLMTSAAVNALRANDGNSPNRSLINANAYLFAYLLLNGTASTAERNAYRNEGKWWVDRNFNNDLLFRSADGIFKEGNGYDTGYQGTALWFMTKLQIHFISPTTGGNEKMAKAGVWLTKRIRQDSGNAVDCTYNTRSGPNNQSGDVKPTDAKSLKRGLWYHGAFANRPTSVDAAAALPAVALSEINGLAPVIFSPLSINVAVGQPIAHTVMATNAGLDSLAGGFNITATGLPAGFSLSGLGFIKSTGTRTISGVLNAPQTVYVTLRANNAFGYSQTVTLRIMAQ